MHNAHPWLLGLDLGPRSHGALAFSAWLRAAADARVFGLHVLEAGAGRFAGDEGEAADAVRTAVDERCERLGLPRLEQVEVLMVPRAEEGLVARCEHAAGLILGRAAPTGANTLVRLGRVARRVLRQLPGPVVVVPPELAEVGPGPILLATDLGPASAGAARFARSFAASVGRTLELVHVGDAQDGDMLGALDPRWQIEREGHRAAVLAATSAWTTEQALGDRPHRVLFGERVAEIAALAEQCHAALIVVGSRQLGVGARIFTTSTASALAGVAGCAVAVIPPA